MRAVVPFAAMLLVLVAGCSCSEGAGPHRNRDAGGTGEVDSQVPPGVDAEPWMPVDSGPPVDAACEVTTPIMNEIVGDPPDMLLVMDISGSMCSPLFPSPMTKLAVMKAALTNLVRAKEARINFGLMLYPGPSDACAPGTVRNPIAPRNAAAITGTLMGLADDLFGCAFSAMGNTPTHTSLDAARAYYATIPVNPIGRYVLLATDGLPNCGAPQPDGSTAATIEETVAAVQALHDDGILTYVLGFGMDISGDPTALARMATAGGTGMPYNASSAMELDMALDAIAAEILPASCTIMLDGPPRDPRLLQVSFDGGALIARNPAHTSGWDYDEATNTITFYGAECTSLQSGMIVSVDVDFGCPGPLI